MNKRRAWTAAEDRCMCEFYPHLTGADMAKVLNRSESSVYQRARTLGLGKSAEFLASDHSGRVVRGKQNAAMVASQFKRGLTPWNKGVKGSTGVQEACRRTQFKKGELMGAARHNYVPVGSLRVNADGYLDRKVTDDQSIYPARRWVAEHRLVWEAANGPIPSGHIVRFKPGMKTTVLEQITVDRLECVTRRENMLRNTVHNYPPEVARLVQLRGALNRQINTRTRALEQA